MRKQLLIIVTVLALPCFAQEAAKPSNERLMCISWKVGTEIDAKEKKHYNIFPFQTAKEFGSAKFYQDMNNGSVYAKMVMANKKEVREEFTKEHYLRYQLLINQENMKTDSLMYADETGPEGSKLIILCANTGENIDSLEKDRFDLFSNYTRKEFLSARIYEQKNGEFLIDIRLKNGGIEKKNYTRARINDMMCTMAEKVRSGSKINEEKPLNSAVMNNGDIYKGRVVENRQEEVLFETEWEVLRLAKKDLREIKGKY